MIKERHKAVPAVYLFLRKGDKILLMRRQGSGYYDGWHSVPSGHVEAGELPIEAMMREAQEEIGITFNPTEARFVHAMYRAKSDETGERVDFFFEVRNWAGEIVNAELNKCADIQWFPASQLPEQMMHHQKIAFENSEKGTLYTELDATQIFLNPTK